MHFQLFTEQDNQSKRQIWKMRGLRKLIQVKKILIWAICKVAKSRYPEMTETFLSHLCVCTCAHTHKKRYFLSLGNEADGLSLAKSHCATAPQCLWINDAQSSQVNGIFLALPTGFAILFVQMSQCAALKSAVPSAGLLSDSRATPFERHLPYLHPLT